MGVGFGLGWGCGLGVGLGWGVDRDEDEADGEDGNVRVDGDRILAVRRAGRDRVDEDHVRLPADRAVGGGPTGVDSLIA